MGSAFFVASSAARFNVSSKVVTCLERPKFIAFSRTLMASGGKGKRITSFLRNPSVTELKLTAFYIPTFRASFKPEITSSFVKSILAEELLVGCKIVVETSSMMLHENKLIIIKQASNFIFNESH